MREWETQWQTLLGIFRKVSEALGVAELMIYVDISRKEQNPG